MKLLSVLGLTALLSVGALLPETMVLPGIENAAIAQTPTTTPAQAQVQLQLDGAKKVVTKNTKGESVVTWQPIGGQAAVKPGDVLRYTVTGKNISDRPANNFVVLQAIPKQTVFNLNSASFGQGTGTLTYSLDRGKTFVEKPMVQVKLANGTMEMRPAPAQVYTHIRWKFTQPVAGKQSVSAMYEVTVR